jgi:DNA-binding NarL/FixJ family response regulator
MVAPVHTVLVIDNDNAYRNALTEALLTAPDLRVVAAASSVKDGLALATTLRPDLVIVDVRMPDGGGPVVARQLSRHLPDLAILALSVHSDAEHQREMINAGADAYVVKGGPIEELLATLRALC